MIRVWLAYIQPNRDYTGDLLLSQRPLLQSRGMRCRYSQCCKPLMFGSDFPDVLAQPESYGGMVKLVQTWMEQDSISNALFHGTAERM
jgi:hypothetical protein